VAELRTCIDGAVATLTISQPARLNALTREMWGALPSALEQAVESPNTRVVVIEGAGTDAFSAGADISEFARVRTDPDDADAYSRAVSQALQVLVAMRVPTVARLRGVCSGGGAAIALTCHMRFASETLRFAIPAARLGIVYEFEAVEQLVRVAGSGNAYDLLSTGRTVGAEEAARLGIVNRVLPAAELDNHVDAYAATIAQNARLPVEGGLTAVGAVLAGGDEELLQRLQELQRAAILSDDFAEGVRAFGEKRKPRFGSNRASRA
jgi:enoyl-CoA hydratase/carnithine racemase